LIIKINFNLIFYKISPHKCPPSPPSPPLPPIPLILLPHSPPSSPSTPQIYFKTYPIPISPIYNKYIYKTQCIWKKLFKWHIRNIKEKKREGRGERRCLGGRC